MSGEPVLLVSIPLEGRAEARLVVDHEGDERRLVFDLEARSAFLDAGLAVRAALAAARERLATEAA